MGIMKKSVLENSGLVKHLKRGTIDILILLLLFKSCKFTLEYLDTGEDT